MANKKKESAFRTTIGGQALIEGIMMLGPDRRATVVRKSDGELEVKDEPRKLVKDKCAVLGWPFIRGVVNFGSSMVNGVRDLFWSADMAVDEDGEEEQAEPSKFEQWLEKHLGSEKVYSLLVGVTAVIAILFSVALFFLLPTFLAGIFDRWISHPIVHNLIEGAIRIIIFMLYLYLISKMKDMRRVFSYHGAEHKTIFCYEAGLPLTVENVRAQPRHHPRCGTSFLFVVIVVAILASSVVFTYVDWSNLWVRLATHLLLLLPVVAISYECNRLVGRYDNALTRLLVRPGLWMQNFTTFEPDDSMIEVGIKALTLVIPEEKGKDAW
ncbi:MAG: DUF1385 domain-containing protein [Oscillospiraceae bacterium]|nr:DUF1385 domain-containing protein [Oscillospiraceae bacterium]